MTAYLRNRLTYVWAFLTAITLLSWWVGRSGGAELQVNAMVTAAVLIMAAVKAQLVIQYFMEVRTSPIWLKRTCYGWVALLLVLLLVFYWIAL